MQKKQVSLFDIAKTFLIIGTVGFGGGLAIISLMQDYCVEKKKWLSLEEFLHGVALGQFMGPFALNSAIFIGYRVRGLVGAIVSSIAFLAPSVSLIIVLSAVYKHFHKLSMFQSALKGLGPVVIALILVAAIKMGKTKIKSLESILLMLASVVMMVVLKMQIIFILLVSFLYAYVKIRFFIQKEQVKEGVND